MNEKESKISTSAAPKKNRKTRQEECIIAKKSRVPLPKENKKKVKEIKRVNCTVYACGYSTPYKKDLVRHMRKHTGEKPYKCPLCSKDFSRLDKLLQHKRVHEGIKSIKCTEPSCNYACIDLSALHRHQLRMHTDEKPFKCQLCPYTSKDSSQLSIHIRFHTGDSPYKCSFEGCSKAFKTNTDLRRHNRVHTKEKPFLCSKCEFSSSLKCNLISHVKNKHPTEILVNNSNNQPQTLTSTDPSTPINTNLSGLAAIDEKEKKSEAECQSSQNQVKSPKTKSPILPFRLACRSCDHISDSSRAFKLHMRYKHKIIDIDDDVFKSLSPQRRKRKSTIAQKTTTADLIRSSFTKGFICSQPTCKASFTCHKSLRCHMKQHVTLHPPPNPTIEIIAKMRSNI